MVIDVDIDNRDQVYNKYLQASVNGVENKPSLLYLGLKTSPYKDEISHYPSRLTQKPDHKNLIPFTKADATFKPYPIVGQLPEIDEQGLNFLHEDIKEACICIGSFSEGEFKAKWLGRNALSNQEFWSGTKIVPILNILSRLNTKLPSTNLDHCNLRGTDQQGNQIDVPVIDLIRDIISYDDNIATSNSLGAMLKRFSPQQDLENWLKSLTGNKELIFRGRYGEKPFIEQPEIFDQTTGQVILTADPKPPEWQSNTISAYDLNRMISMLGWHHYLPQTSRLPGAQWHSIESVIKAMGSDPARLADLAIQELGLQTEIDSTVIISKLGNGVTKLRYRTETVYTALVQFVKRSHKNLDQPAKLITLSMALRGARVLEPRDFNREVLELDARMVAEVTEILHRAVMADWI
ncbi:MAG: peptidoglycan-binding protein [Symploca sp. SIO2E9]|nr:peptidoglycan-binding protein [Symploca sp. SIO2E9]